MLPQRASPTSGSARPQVPRWRRASLGWCCQARCCVQQASRTVCFWTCPLLSMVACLRPGPRRFLWRNSFGRFRTEEVSWLLCLQCTRGIRDSACTRLPEQAQGFVSDTCCLKPHSSASTLQVLCSLS